MTGEVRSAHPWMHKVGKHEQRNEEQRNAKACVEISGCKHLGEFIPAVLGTSLYPA